MHQATRASGRSQRLGQVLLATSRQAAKTCNADEGGCGRLRPVQVGIPKLWTSSQILSNCAVANRVAAMCVPQQALVPIRLSSQLAAHIEKAGC